MSDKKQYMCPKHNVPLKKMRVMYGMPDPKSDYSNVILGGCCFSDNSPRFGYECPTDREVYYLDVDSNLYREYEEDLDPDYQI